MAAMGTQYRPSNTSQSKVVHRLKYPGREAGVHYIVRNKDKNYSKLIIRKYKRENGVGGFPIALEENNNQKNPADLELYTQRNVF